MFNIFRKQRNILVDFEDLANVLNILDKHDLTWQYLADLKIGNCGWKKAPNCWFVHVRATNKTWISVLRSIKQNNITLLDETTGY